MSTLAINAGEDQAMRCLPATLARLAPGAPVVVMVHGFRYCPSGRATDPHRHILSDNPETDHWKAVSWPGMLGLRGEHGLAIGFGWSAGGTIWGAYRRSTGAGQALGDLLETLHRLAPGHPVHLVAHSLGARVALRGAARAGTVRRAILINPAMFRSDASDLRDPLRGTEVFSVLTRENRAYDWMLRAVLPSYGPTLGRGGPDWGSWLDLHLSHPDALRGLAQLGHDIAPPQARICHWSGYVRAGVWDFYRRLIHRPSETPLPLLRAATTPQADHGPSPVFGWRGQTL